jgi:anhydro-N-acetylmuramic acid kinase
VLAGSAIPSNALISKKTGFDMSLFRSIGLMSGTSLDGIDVALLTTDGQSYIDAGPHLVRPYLDHERALLREALQEAVQLSERQQRTELISRTETMLTHAHADAVEQFCAHTGIDLSSVDVIGFHGQTILHQPEHGLTIQIGNAPLLYERLKRPLIYDFRAADVAAGGQGAPLVPLYHKALIDKARAHQPLLNGVIAVLNIGGVSNITVITEQGEVMASDVGPGNAHIDDFMMKRRGEAFDASGALAREGRVAQDILAYWLAHPFFGAPAPKSLDRNAFSTQHSARLSDADGAATLTAFTAHSIAFFARHIPRPPDLWIVCGGGAHNSTLMSMLRSELQKPVMTADDLQWSVDALEAQAFAYLAVRSKLNLPLTFPTTTGVPEPQTGGVAYP